METNDVERTRLCAEAMDLDLGSDWNQGTHVMLGGHGGRTMEMYDPLHDDAQAMALVKHLRLHINDMQDGNTRAWGVFPGARGGLGVYGRNLNRAIVECVAKMQKAKVTA